MKAHINGITVEGTPQEIMEYQRMQANKKPLSEVCKEIGQSLGALIAVSHGIERMNQQLKRQISKQNVSRTGEGVKIYGGYTNQDHRPTH